MVNLITAEFLSDTLQTITLQVKGFSVKFELLRVKSFEWLGSVLEYVSC